MTCWRSTRARVVRRPTVPRTTSPCWSGRCPDCRAATGAGCWCGWTGPGSPTNCSNTSPLAAPRWAGTGSPRLRWSCTDKEIDAIQRLPKGAWTTGIDQNGDLVEDTFVADLTSLLDLGRWHTKIPGLRIIVRDEPLHPATASGPPNGTNSSVADTS